MNKEYYLIKYNSPNCFEAYIINKDNYEYINKNINVYYEYITFEDITGKKIRINKNKLSSIALERIVEKVNEDENNSKQE